jgi:endonuclease/exonuclease/phosphatase family metal-dependent hydrolase
MEPDARVSTAAEARPTSSFPPIVVNRATTHEGSHLRVVLLNAASGRRFREILKFLQRPPLRAADVILLCEVNSGMSWSPGRDVAVELGEALKMSCAYVPQFGFARPGGKVTRFTGNAILSSASFEDVLAVPIYRPAAPYVWSRGSPRWKRVGGPAGIVTRVKFSGAEITVGVAHMHSRCAPAERARQMASYLEWFPRSGRAIFGGDLNTTTVELPSRAHLLPTMRQMFVNPQRFRAPQPYEPLFEHLRDHGLQIDGLNVPDRPTFTFSGLIPRSMRPKLDWLAVRDLRPVAGTAAVIEPRSLLRRASDHDFVTVALEL